MASVCELSNILNEADHDFVKKVLEEGKNYKFTQIDTKWQLFQERLIKPLRSKISSNLLYTKGIFLFF